MNKFQTSDLLSHKSRLSNVSKVMVTRKGAEKDSLTRNGDEIFSVKSYANKSNVGSRRNSLLDMEDIESIRQKANSKMLLYSETKDADKKHQKKVDNLMV